MMIELSIYLATVSILSAIIVAFVIHNIREPRIKSSISELKKQVLDIQSEQKETIIKNNDLQAKNNTQQEQITEQERKLGLFSKYTFDPRMSFFRLGDKGYCAVCLLQFKEVQIGITGNQFKCPSCGTDYARTSGMIVIDENYKPDDRR